MNVFQHFHIYKVEKRLIRGFCRDIKTRWLQAWRWIDTKLAMGSWKKLSKKTPIVDNQIMFRTYQDKYTCNPKYLCEQLIRSGREYSLVWVYSGKTGDLDQFPPQVKLVKFGTYEYYKQMAASKFWIDNAHNFTWEGFPKKKEQVLINLWHGSLGLKRINPDADSNAHRRRAGKLGGLETNYCVSNSDFEDMVYRTSYWPNTPFLKYGHVRNDLMFADAEALVPVRKKVYETLGIPEYKQIMLYAPTFRDGEDFECFDIDYAGLKRSLEERFGGEWVIVSRLHFHTQAVIKKNACLYDMPSYDFVISGDTYDDMQELIAASAAAITDYSSWICDFVLTGRPAFLFVTDMDSYVTERGFYYPLEDTPFEVCRNNAQLLEAVKVFEETAYAEKVDAYLKKLGCVEDGHAGERLVELIESEIQKAKEAKK